MADVVIIGAGVAGLSSALTLSRTGHTVTLIERDATPLPTDAHGAFEWDRRGAPQVRHSHAFLARLRNALRDRYPDVLDALFAAGATEMDFIAMLPEGMDRTPHPGDDDLVALACRRTTFEWVLRRVVLADPTVSLLDGRTVTSLSWTAGSPPVVTGVVLVRETMSPDLRVQGLVHQWAWRERAHAAGVRPLVVVEDALVVLRGPNRKGAGAVAQDEERHLRSDQALLDDQALASVAKTTADHRGGNGLLCRGEVGRNHHALAGGEAVSLQHDRKAERTRAHDGERVGGRLSGMESGCRHVMPGHEGLREGLAGFELRRGGRGTEQEPAGGSEGVGDTGAERQLGADDGQVGPLAFGKGQHGSRIAQVDRMDRDQLRDPGVARGCDDGHARLGGEPGHERVLAPAAS